ncbi:hypothetical protein Pst134EA_019623 [Puccinia striiformis f. sp. tritici]|uniref:hypothetical protein n=1 Tax=Puccinia striiformis f. sp. tritici TaxID=168172 RepID=UPI0020075C39|nr:hypothetical protein Pst134EA_019623 [Puccinia striiformis f. sp. tritici]KAH9459470.1 hypothetical protein Pst134EA_019623 [Puccinia striiformis f. sp. tritici]
MYHRHSANERPATFEYERTEQHHHQQHQHQHQHPHHHQPHHQPHHPYPQFDSRRHPSSHHHHHHPTSTRTTSDHRFHPTNTDRLPRSTLASSTPTSRPIDRRIDYPERNSQPRQISSNNHNGSFEDSRRTYESSANHKLYEDHHSRESPPPTTTTTTATTNNHHNTSSTTPTTTTTTTPNIHRRSDDFPASRSARYNPYPPSGPRAESHLSSSVGRIPNGTSGHGPYNGPPSYDERIPGSRSHDHISQRTYDPNSQFNHGPPKDKSPPSQSVIFMGLPIHTDESNLRAFLEECCGGTAVDSVTIIYDRITGQSKRYGFARFLSVDHARSFVEPNFPMITWKEPTGSRSLDRSGDGLKVKIDYSQKEKVPFEVRQRERESLPSRSTPATPFINDLPSNNPSSYQYQQQHKSTGPESSLPTNLNDGARDIGGTPTSILLLRGLDPLSTEQEIAQHLQHIPDPSQTVLPESLRKVMLIKDRLTRSSWGYAFVQFADVQVAVKALSLLLNTSLFPRGFQIRSRTITVTFAHEHSFHPIYTPSDWSFKGASGQQLAYWDDKAYAALYISPISESDHPSSQSNKIKTTPRSKQQTQEGEEDEHSKSPSKSNGRHVDEDTNDVNNDQNSLIDAEPPGNSSRKEMSIIDQENFFKQQQSSSSTPSSSTKNNSKFETQETNDKNNVEDDDRLTLIDSQSSEDLRSKKDDHSSKLDPKSLQKSEQINSGQGALSSSSSSLSSHHHQPNHHHHHHHHHHHQSENLNSKPKEKGAETIKNQVEKKKTNSGSEPIATKKMVANIQKWQSKHQEITSAGTTTTTTTTTTEGEKTHVTIAPEHLVIDEDDFSDYDRLTCVLCQRQFKSPEDLQRHNNLSNLHKTNLQNEKARKIGRAKKAASLARKGNLGLTLSNPNTNSATSNAIEGSNSNSNAESTTKYTDRAAARREAFGQPDAPNADKHEAKKARFEPAPPPALPPAQPDKDGIQATNVGSKMLEKMGWSKGEGLGNGNGRVEPVLASQYIKGVGLGASAGVTVGQYDDSKKGFMDSVKDKTVARFNSNSNSNSEST